MSVEQSVKEVLSREVSRRKALQVGGVAALGLAFSKPLVTSILPRPAFAGAGYGPPTFPCPEDIDFNNPIYGFTKGCVVADLDQPGFAILVSTIPNSGTPAGHPAVIFDSAMPTSITGNDFDLGTANQLAPGGGPGIGSGGEPGKPGENLVALGNLLIIQEGLTPLPGDATKLLPDDWALGGTLRFDFDPAVNIGAIQVVDIDQDETGGAVCITHGVGGVIHAHGMQALGNNSVQWVHMAEPNVVRMDVKFPSSGALSAITFFCPE